MSGTAIHEQLHAAVWARSRGPANDDAQVEARKIHMHVVFSIRVGFMAQDGSVPGTLSAAYTRAGRSDSANTGDPCTARSSQDSAHAYLRITGSRRRRTDTERAQASQGSR